MAIDYQRAIVNQAKTKYGKLKWVECSDWLKSTCRSVAVSLKKFGWMIWEFFFRPGAKLANRPAANSRAVGKIDVIFTVLGSGNLADKYNFLEYWRGILLP